MAPLVSVLLPTRDRLEFLRYAIETVLRQDDPDWEIVVSDNDSGEDIAGHLDGLADERIRYVRTPSFVPVTDNWNSALKHSTGRYVVMLGDDDGLMPGRGCESGGLEEYKNFRYLANARIDVTGETGRPYLEQLGPTFERAGFSEPDPGERPGGRTLRATSGDVSATFSELPGQGDYLLLSVAGPCIDVPEEDRDDWLTRDEPTPEIP